MPEQSPTLRELIQNALDGGAAYRQLEMRATDPETGETASRAIFLDTVSGKLDRMPREHHLRAVAAALRLPYERVRLAAIEQWLPAAGRSRNTEREALREKVRELQEQARRLQAEADAITASIERPERPKSA